MKNYEENKIREHCQSKIDEFMKGDDTYTVHGPYTSKTDGRKRAIIVIRQNDTFIKRGVSWPKLMAEILLDGDVWDTVDHVNRDHTNDDVFNLRELPREKHASDDALRVVVENVECQQCGAVFTPTKSQRNEQGRTNSNKAGPFCSKRCTGLYGANVQNGGKVFERTEVKKTYFRIDK